MISKPRGQIPYVNGEQPNFWLPDPAAREHRFVLGRLLAGSNPLVVMGMNPSHANDVDADRTVNKVIDASIQLGYTGWTMLNLYPERAPSPKQLNSFDKDLSDMNCEIIGRFITSHSIGEVFGGWGDPPHPTIRKAKRAVLAELRRLGTRVFYIGDLTQKGEPRHPNPRRGVWDLTSLKSYLIT